MNYFEISANLTKIVQSRAVFALNQTHNYKAFDIINIWFIQTFI